MGIKAGATLDRNVAPLAWMPNSSALLAIGNDGTQVSLWRVPLAAAPARLPLGDLSASDASVAKTGAIALVGQRPHHPTEAYVIDSAASSPRRLTNFNTSIGARDNSDVSAVHWTFEGYHEDGVLVLPPRQQAGNALPARRHHTWRTDGGIGYGAFGGGFGGLARVLAAHGDAVFEPNYCGSDNLGARYQDATIGDLGAGPGRDPSWPASPRSSAKASSIRRASPSGAGPKAGASPRG